MLDILKMELICSLHKLTPKFNKLKRKERKSKLIFKKSLIKNKNNNQKYLLLI